MITKIREFFNGVSGENGKNMIKYFCCELQNHITLTGCGSAWLERLIWDQEVAGSNPVTPT